MEIRIARMVKMKKAVSVIMMNSNVPPVNNVYPGFKYVTAILIALTNQTRAIAACVLRPYLQGYTSVQLILQDAYAI